MMMVLIMAVCIMTMNCKNEYHQLVEQELEKNIRNDTLFIGLQFGMSAREFFDYCWELNKSGLVSEGFSNMSVLYKLARFGKRYDINFYPNFLNDKIVSLPVDYSYEVTAPWNPKYSVDSLFIEVVAMQKELYGNDFLKIADPKRGAAFVRVDGNRRISIFKNIDRNNVTVLFRDLSVDIDKVQ